MVSPAASPSAPIDLRLLGSLTVTVDGIPVALGGPRQMAVLGRLMLTPGQVVSMDQLVDSVWDGDEPAQPNVALRSYVSNLRRAIEPDRRRRASDSLMASVQPGYRLAIDPVSVDWIRFERLVEDGRVWLADGDFEAAIECLMGANALWRGEPCAGLPESQTFLAHRGRMTKLREAAVELLYEALLLRGDHAAVVNQIEAAIADHPLQERLTELGMIAFYRSGRQSEALGLGQKLRIRLRDNLGIDPSPAIEAMELKILNHDQSLDWPDVGHRPTEIRRPDGGDGSVRQVPSRPQSSVLDRPGSGLAGLSSTMAPSPPVGRDRELAALDRMLPVLVSGRSVTAVVTGEQGIGKTALVDATAERLANQGVSVFRARSIPDGAAPLWSLAQLVLAAIERLESDGDFEPTPDLHPLAALGPTVAGALGLAPAMLSFDNRDPSEHPMGDRTTDEEGDADRPLGDPVAVPDDPVAAPDDPVAALDDPGTGLDGGSDDPPAADENGSETELPADRRDEPYGDIAGSTGVDARDANADYDGRAHRSGALDLDRISTGAGAGGAVEPADVTMACLRLFERLTRTGPIALILEDLHWTDRATAAALNFATRAAADKPIGFILTWRDLDARPSPATDRLRELAGLPRLIRVDLHGLDLPAVAQLVDTEVRRGSVDAVEIAGQTGGNPLLIRELLALPDHRVPTGGPSRSSLVDVVRDRLTQVDPSAVPVLTVGALFRRPFTVSAVQAVSGLEQSTVRTIVDLSVRAGLLTDDDPTSGAYRFRHPVIAEVLTSQLLASERAVKHRLAGRHLLAVGASTHEAAHHLAASPEMQDRLLAARLALRGLRENFDSTRLVEVDRHLGAGFAPTDSAGAEQSKGHPSGDPGAGPVVPDHEPGVPWTWARMLSRANEMAGQAVDPLNRALGVDALAHLSWRAWVDGRPPEWLEAGRQALARAQELHELIARTPARSRGQSSTSARSSTGGSADRSDSLHRLARTALNLAGAPVHPVGPMRTGGFAPLPGSVVEDLRTAAETLADHPARPVLQVHLGHRDSATRLGAVARGRAVRDAQKQVTAARRRLGTVEVAAVQMAVISCFGEEMDPAVRLEAIEEIEQARPGIEGRIFAARHAYPALLELGKSYDAERRVERLLSESVGAADPLHVAEARLLWIRHLLWVGGIDPASEEVQRALDELSELGIDEPVSLIRQRRTIRLLRGVPLGSGHGPDSHDQLHGDRVRAPERAMRLARLGDVKRAVECLETTLDTITVRHVSLSDQALTAMAAAMLGHEKAAKAVYDLLAPAGDRPVVRSDGSVIFGPASLYAGLAAEVAAMTDEAAVHIDDARRAVQRFGGSPASLDLVISQARPRTTGAGDRPRRMATDGPTRRKARGAAER